MVNNIAKSIAKIKHKIDAKEAKKEKRTVKKAGAQKGNQHAKKWNDKERKELCDSLLLVANDELKPEYTLKQICYRAGHAYDDIDKLKDAYNDVFRTWKQIKSVLQQRWLQLAIKNEGNSKVVNQFLNYHSVEITDHEDDREVKRTKRIEKVKADEKIRTQNALVNDNKDILIDIVTNASQAIQDINAKKKQEQN